MRGILALVVLIAYPAVVSGQSRSAGPTTPSLPPIGLPLAQIGLPLSPIGLPLPPIGLPAQPSPRTRESAPHPPRAFRPSVRRPTGLLIVPQYWWEWPGSGDSTPPPSSEPLPPIVAAPRTGTLRLAIDPFDAQLFVDGEYIGTAEDFNGDVELEEGSHVLEIRAQGFESLAFRVKIAAGRAIRYAGSLVRTPGSEPPPPPPPAHDTFYYIPGCYLGNVPPEKVNLPATCDFSRLITSKR